jgi:methylated-DNA-protein-cysteine methyltransferase-like protein
VSEEPSFFERAADVISRIPRGTVASYGQVAAIAGNPRAARQVVRVLHAWSRERGLPWHRVVNAKGAVSLPKGGGFELQRALLEEEGVAFGPDGRIDLARYGWKGLSANSS